MWTNLTQASFMLNGTISSFPKIQNMTQTGIKHVLNNDLELAQFTLVIVHDKRSYQFQSLCELTTNLSTLSHTNKTQILHSSCQLT